MATRAASPGSALLRSSRMFSLPAPLPVLTREAANAKRASDTATTPYPIMQAITTPATSLRRGDWGFKRPLPLKSTTNTTTPLVRVKHVDTIEHITDYSSSSDLTLTLDKFHELNMPLSQPNPDNAASRQLPTRSVFEDEFDTLPTKGHEERSRKSRWKFEGPWLAGISNGQFNAYAEKVEQRRAEFREYLKHIIAAENNVAAAAAALDKDGGPLEPLTAADITDAQLTEYLRKLRGQDDRAILTEIVGKFLDLAPIAPPPVSNAEQVARLPVGSSLRTSEERKVKESGTGYGGEADKSAAQKSQSPYAQEGPPATHPSAGLSYLRTSAFLENHPLYGPQVKPTPVLGRVIKPSWQGQPVQIGVGGIVAVPLTGESGWSPNTGKDSASTGGNLGSFDPEIRGGKKQYVQLQSARIGPSGKVVMQIWDGDKEAANVAKEMVGEEKVFGNPLVRSEGLNNTYAWRLQKSDRANNTSGNRVTGSSETYGFRD